MCKQTFHVIIGTHSDQSGRFIEWWDKGRTLYDWCASDNTLLNTGNPIYIYPKAEDVWLPWTIVENLPWILCSLSSFNCQDIREREIAVTHDLSLTEMPPLVTDSTLHPSKVPKTYEGVTILDQSKLLPQLFEPHWPELVWATITHIFPRLCLLWPEL